MPLLALPIDNTSYHMLHLQTKDSTYTTNHCKFTPHHSHEHMLNYDATCDTRDGLQIIITIQTTFTEIICTSEASINPLSIIAKAPGIAAGGGR